MSPITLIAKSFPIWLLAVPVIFIVLIFITWTPAATEDEKEVLSLRTIRALGPFRSLPGAVGFFHRKPVLAIFVTFCENLPGVSRPRADESSFTEDRKGHEDKPWT